MNKITLNSSIYPRDVVFSAAYSLMDKAYFLFDQDEQKNLIINIEPKQGNGQTIEAEFKEQLLNLLTYSQNLKSTKEIRTLILKRALLLPEDFSKESNIQNQHENENPAKK